MYPGATAEEVIEGIHVIRFRYFFKKLEILAGSTGILPTIRRKKYFVLIVPFFLIAAFLSLFKFSIRLRPNIIHAHWLIPQGVIAYLIGKICRTKYAVTAHGADVFGLKGLLFDKIRSIVIKNAVVVTSVSKALKESLLQNSGTGCRIDILPMGVDSAYFSTNMTEESRTAAGRKSFSNILYVGRLTEKKGVEYLIRAIPQVKREYADIQLTIVGSGELENSLKKLANQLGLEGNIQFRGAVPNLLLPAIYKQHSIFVAPSIEARGGDTEGFGLTLVEASMAGCLVVSTKVGGIIDIIQHRVTGLLVEQKSEQEIARSILYALENLEQMQVIAAAGRNHCIENYDWQVIAGKYCKLFKEVM
jgi:glycosyltransferase involved in cell wall biosynthesis